MYTVINKTLSNGRIIMTEKFKNPLLEHGADPFVTFWNGKYYYVYSVKDEWVEVSQADNIHHITREGKKVWIPDCERRSIVGLTIGGRRRGSSVVSVRSGRADASRRDSVSKTSGVVSSRNFTRENAKDGVRCEPSVCMATVER